MAKKRGRTGGGKGSRRSGYPKGVPRPTFIEAQTDKIERKNPELKQLLDALQSAIEGNFDAIAGLQTRAMAELELIRMKCVKEIEENGVIVMHDVMSREGHRIASIRKDNPVLFHLLKMYEIQGYTAKDLLLSKKARGESGKDTAMAKLITERHARLLSADSTRLPPPRPAIETTAVEKSPPVQ